MPNNQQSPSTVTSSLEKENVKNERFWINVFVGIAFMSIGAGLIVLFVFLYNVSVEHEISGRGIDFAKTGQVGDFIGGIVGAVWSLTGVLLFYATLRLQSVELKENRIHFQLNRLTDIIYKQIEVFSYQIQNITFYRLGYHDNTVELKGREATTFLRKELANLQIEIEVANAKGDTKAVKASLDKRIQFFAMNIVELQNIYEELSNNVDTIKAILIKEDIPPADLNELKGIFFRNIGREFLNSSEQLLPIIDMFIKNRAKNSEDYNEAMSVEGDIKAKINSIIEFRRTFYNKQIIRSYLQERDLYNVHHF